jgi:hypothetical protein
MGYDAKAAVDKVTSLTAEDGKCSIKKASECARSSPSHAKMHTMPGVNKKTQMHNICRAINEKMIQPLIIEVASARAELIEDLQQEIKRLNNELTGTEEIAPKNEAEERHEQDVKNLLSHVLQVEKMKKQLANIKKMAASQNEKAFGSSIEEVGAGVAHGHWRGKHGRLGNGGLRGGGGGGGKRQRRLFLDNHLSAHI